VAAPLSLLLADIGQKLRSRAVDSGEVASRSGSILHESAHRCNVISLPVSWESWRKDKRGKEEQTLRVNVLSEIQLLVLRFIVESVFVQPLQQRNTGSSAYYAILQFNKLRSKLGMNVKTRGQILINWRVQNLEYLVIM
jgi:hypothetical protein